MATATRRLEEALGTVELTARERQKFLGAERPRLVLEVLAGEMTPLELDTLATEVARREEGVAPDDEAAVRRVSKTLRYDYLPSMADAGVLNYDPEANLVEPALEQRYA